MKGESNHEVGFVFGLIIRPIYWSFLKDNQATIQVLDSLLCAAPVVYKLPLYPSKHNILTKICENPHENPPLSHLPCYLLFLPFPSPKLRVHVLASLFQSSI